MQIYLQSFIGENETFVLEDWSLFYRRCLVSAYQTASASIAIHYSGYLAGNLQWAFFGEQYFSKIIHCFSSWRLQRGACHWQATKFSGKPLLWTAQSVPSAVDRQSICQLGDSIIMESNNDSLVQQLGYWTLYTGHSTATIRRDKQRW